MNNTLHITSGDGVGGNLEKAGLSGEILVWHDILYDGPRNPGWPMEETLDARALFLEQATGGGLSKVLVRETLAAQYQRLAKIPATTPIVLWFDACLFDQSMLAHILTCLDHRGLRQAELLCVDAFPGIEPYDGIGQLTSLQLASLYGRRRPITEEQFRYAQVADRAFAIQDMSLLTDLARATSAPLPWVPAAAARWLQEQPDAETGLGRLDQLILNALRTGSQTPAEIYKTVSASERHPQFWGDTTLWAKINGLAERKPPRVRIEGPAARLPQWPGQGDLTRFAVFPLNVER